MHTIRGAREFVNTLNPESRKKLARGLFLPDSVTDERLAMKVCDVFYTIRALRELFTSRGE